MWILLQFLSWMIGSHMPQNFHVRYICPPVYGKYAQYTQNGVKLNQFQSGKLNKTRKDYKGSKIVINDRKDPGENKYTMCRTNLRLLLAERKQKRDYYTCAELKMEI